MGVAANGLEGSVLAVEIGQYWLMSLLTVRAKQQGRATYRRCLFFGPGFPLALDSPLVAGAALLTPFFFSGGPMTDGAGVPSAVAGLESDARFSVGTAGAAVGVETGDTFESLAGVSSLTDCNFGLMIARSRSDGTLRVTIFESLAVSFSLAAEDLRGLSLAEAAALVLDGGMASILLVMTFGVVNSVGVWVIW